MAEPEYFRNPELLNAENSALVVIDVQEKLVPAISAKDLVVRNVERLLDAGQLLGIPVFATEQYPQGLGASIPTISERFAKHPPIAKVEKRAFSCWGNTEFRASLVGYSASRGKNDESNLANLVLCGIESHVCVLQSALDLLGNGYRVTVAADAIGSRSVFDHEIALRRMESQGIVVASTEAIMFEWCETAENPMFKSVQRLLK